MANGNESGPTRPDWVVAGLRCTLEVTLIVLSTAFVTVNADSAIVVGLALVVGISGAVMLVLWCVKRQIVAWIRYASRLSRRRRSTRG